MTIDQDNHKGSLGELAIPQIVNKVTGEIFDSQEFFLEPEEKIWAARLGLVQGSVKHLPPHFVCLACGNKVKIRGNYQRNNHQVRYHFAHLRDSQNCPYKTDIGKNQDTIRRMKYNGAKEGGTHLKLKERLEYSLRQTENISDIKVEKRQVSIWDTLKWRKPDIQCQFGNRNLVFEVQVSTEFVEVIVSRQVFYTSNHQYLLWILPYFPTNSELQRFTHKDILYSNNRNVFVLPQNNEATPSGHPLKLEVHFQVPAIVDCAICDTWQSVEVPINEITFNKSTFKCFYYDYDAARKLLDLNLTEQIAVREAKKELAQSKNDQWNLFLQDMMLKLKDSKLTSTIKDSKNYFNISVLYENGYRPSKYEMDVLKYIYSKYKDEQGAFFCDGPAYVLSWIFLHYKLKQSKDHHILARMERAVFGILSMKLGKPIGFAYDKLIQVAHQMYPIQRSCINTFIKSITVYEREQALFTDDTSGKWKLKLIQINSESTIQDSEKNRVLKLIFPELSD